MSIGPARGTLAFILVAAGVANTALLQAQAPPPAVPYQDPTLSDEERRPVPLGDAAISILGTAYWRDWMPIVSRPGPDGGSPLRATLRFWLGNNKGEAALISYKVLVMDAKGKSYPVSVKLEPNFRVLPEKARALYRDGDAALKDKLIAEYRVMWDGMLKAGESRELDLSFSDGPYLPARSAIHAEVTWTDAKGHSVIMKTPENLVKRTD